MFVSARMKKIEILTLVSDEPKVTEAVGEMGVLHLTRAPVEGGAVPFEGPDTRESEARLRELESRAEALCTALGVHTDAEPKGAPPPTIQEAEQELRTVDAEAGHLIEARERLGGSRRRVENLLRDTSALAGIDAPLDQIEQMSFLHFAIGTLGSAAATETEKELGDRAVVLPYTTPFGDSKVVAVSSKKGRWALETALEKRGFRRDNLPEEERDAPARVAELAERRLGLLLAQAKENREAAQSALGKYGDRLLAIRRRIRTEHRLVLARSNFAHTWATMLITGWLPADRVNALCETVLGVTAGRAVIEIRDPAAADEEPPTLMRNHPLVRPFELLTSAYSTPDYNEIEPTPFIALLFVLMFGLMFGDVGHSALLLVVGIALWLKARGRLHDAGVILTFCAVSGLVFGAVYGSVFGMETIGGRELGFLHPLKNANRILAVTVLFGIGVITLGIILNVVNRFRRREYAEGWLGRFGVLGGVFYWGAIVIAARGYATGDVGWLPVVALLVVPLTVLALRAPAQAIAARARGRRGPDAGGVFVSVIEGGAEAFETVLAYVANTLSFVRIGAFALAHAGLCLAVFRLMAIVEELPGGPVWAVLVFVFGTLLIVGLEGLIVAIQTLRLEYYEFFGKFFRGEGRRYEPFDLKA